MLDRESIESDLRKTPDVDPAAARNVPVSPLDDLLAFARVIRARLTP